MEQISMTRGIQSGVGVVALHGVANQTGNLLNIDPFISTAPLKIGHTKVDGTYRRRFGNVVNQKNTEFDFPRGAPGVYAQSKAGTEGLGNLGDGGVRLDSRDSEFKPAADLLEAQGIVNREVRQETHFARPEHYHYVDRTKESMTERFINMAQDYQRDRIKDLMAKGFSAEEIKAKLDREREKAIDRAEKMPMNATALLQAQIAKRMPDQLTEDFPNTSVAPGGIPTARDTSAYQRAVDAGSAVNRAKKFQQMNVAMRIAGEVSHVEEPRRDVEREMAETQHEIVDRVAREHASEKEKIHSLEQRDIEQQQRVEKAEDTKEAQMMRAMGMEPRKRVAVKKSAILAAEADYAERKKISEEGQSVKLKAGPGRPRKIYGQIRSVEHIQEMATREQQSLAQVLPGFSSSK